MVIRRSDLERSQTRIARACARQPLQLLSRSRIRLFSRGALRLLDSQLGEISTVVPGWFPVADYRERLVLHPGDIRGETFLLVSKIDNHHPLQFTNHANLAAGRKHTLRLRVGNQPGQKWKLTIRALNRSFCWNRKSKTQAARMDGGMSTVDLSSFAGQTISLRLIQSSINSAAAEAAVETGGIDRRMTIGPSTRQQLRW